MGQAEAAVLRAAREALQARVRAGETVLVAVSGGPDSTCLADVLAALAPSLGLRVVVACVDHQLRPGSADEAERVRALAERLGLPFALERVRVGVEGGLEAAARRARYTALERLADVHGAAWIATGHTASDQAETLLLRLGRGAGLRGARGILQRRGRVIRPLLEVTRAQVERYLAGRGLVAPVQDPSNADLGRARNRIRHRVLPELRLALGPGADRALARFCALAGEDEAALRAMADLPVPAPRGQFMALPAAAIRRWVRDAAEGHGIRPNAAELRAATQAIERPGARRLELGRRLLLDVGENEVDLRPAARRARSPEPAAVPLAEGRRVSLAWAGLDLILERRRPAVAQGPWELALPGDARLPLFARRRRPGDRFKPLGVGTSKLKRLLIGLGIPREERDRLAVLADADGALLWVVGHRVGEGARAGQGAPDGWVIRAERMEAKPAKRASTDRVMNLETAEEARAKIS